MAGRKDRTPLTTPKTLTPKVHAQSPGWLSHSGPSLPADAGVVDQEVDLAVARDDGSRELVHGRGIGDVADMRVH